MKELQRHKNQTHSIKKTSIDQNLYCQPSVIYIAYNIIRDWKVLHKTRKGRLIKWHFIYSLF